MEKPQNFREFWDFYVTEHSRPETRRFHLIGTILGIILLAALIWFGRWYLFPLALIPSYGCAWYSHFYVEHNQPATFKYPLWSLAGDYKMVWLMLTGRMNAEIARVNNRSNDANSSI